MLPWCESGVFRIGTVRLSSEENAVGDVVSYHVRVSDSGIGISTAFLPKLFDAYSQEVRNSASPSEGTGLGLHIVKMLVDIAKESIEVSSTPSVGTVFTVSFSLPRVTHYTPAVNLEAAEGDACSCFEGKRILLCEDQEINAALVKAMLGGWKMEVTWVRDGKAALDAFVSEPPGTYALVLMDRRMPVLDGVAAVKSIRRLAREDAATIPVLAMTGDTDRRSLQECLDAGMNDYLVKPFDRKELLQKCLLFVTPNKQDSWQ